MTQFTFYEIYKDVMEMLDDDATRGQFMKAICKFMFEEEPVKPPKGNKSEYFWENIIDVMTESKEAEKNGKRLATFPDLMVTLDRETGEVLSSAQIQNGRQVTVVSVPRSELILGEGMREETSFREAEKIIGKSLW